jgi:hypothetical protein
MMMIQAVAPLIQQLSLTRSLLKVDDREEYHQTQDSVQHFVDLRIQFLEMVVLVVLS